MFLFVRLSAQIDSINTLPDVTVKGGKNGEATCFEISADFRNFYKNKTAADWLSENTGAFIKSYSPGGVATISLRGGTAGHTAVLWNGLNINHNMLGLCDLSLLPTGFIDEATLQVGGESTRYGSGAMTGALNLVSGYNTPAFQVFTQVGSFKSFRLNGGLNFSKILSKEGKSRLQNDVRLFFQQAENDFSYINTASVYRPTVKQSNAQTQSIGLMVGNGYLFKNNTLLEHRLWWQKSFRQVPASMTSGRSQSAQKDINLRTYLKYGNEHHFVRAAYFQENLIYADTAISLFDSSLTQTYLVDFEIFIKKSKINSLKTGGITSRQTAMSESYGENIPSRYLFAIWLADTLKFEKSRYTASIRGEYMLRPIVTGFLQGEWTLKNTSLVRMKLGRHFRLPTFNDLYWEDAFAIGNINLKPETAYSIEIGNVYKRNKLNTEFAVYARTVKDMIHWQYFSNLWQPINQSRVISIGGEIRCTTGIFTIQKQGFSLEGLYAYNNTRSFENRNADANGKQLSYTPQHQGHTQLRWTFKSWNASFSTHFYGKRFTTTTESKFLKPYTLCNFDIYKIFIIKNKYMFNIDFKINNLFGKSYQIMENRPMPGRSFELGIRGRV